MVTARLYIEGGGDSKEQAIRFRQGWNDFFARAGVAGKTRVVRGDGRGQTFDRFATAGCTKRYEKGRISFELLASVDPALIENACPHAGALMSRLRAL
jgi:hypothetical protein